MSPTAGRGQELGTEPGTAPAPTLATALAESQRRLAAAGVPSPSADAHALLAHVLGVDRRELSRRIVLRHTLTDPQAERLAELAGLRADRVPLQHLTGTTGFRRLELRVGPGVFVPRVESELVAGLAVEEAARLVANGVSPLVVDLCTGSGAIALAVAEEVPQARVVAVELSADAVAWAELNVAALGLAGRVELRAGDAGSPEVVADLAGTAHVVVANPPYVPDGARPTEPEVRDHDPAVALYGGGEDGLAVPRRVVGVAAGLLRPGGLFVMEHADVQGAATRSLVSGPGWGPARTERDLAGRDRALVVRSPSDTDRALVVRSPSDTDRALVVRGAGEVGDSGG